MTKENDDLPIELQETFQREIAALHEQDERGELECVPYTDFQNKIREDIAAAEESILAYEKKLSSVKL